jgi:hemoglobin
VVDDFVARCAADARINGKFARTDVPRLKKMLVDQVTAASGGPATYAGRNMKQTHDGMGVTAGEFDALVGDLVATLDRFSVPAAEQQELLASSGRSAAKSSRWRRQRRQRLFPTPTATRRP